MDCTALPLIIMASLIREAIGSGRVQHGREDKQDQSCAPPDSAPCLDCGALQSQEATTKMKNVPWDDPGFMGLLALAGGSSLSSLKLQERAQRVFAAMMSSEAMRAALLWQ